MKVVLFCCCICFTNNICFGLETIDQPEYNANLSSVVLVEILSTWTGDSSITCTGVIISETLVLTAATCFRDNPPKGQNVYIQSKGFVYVGNQPNIKNKTKFNITDYKISPRGIYFFKNERKSSSASLDLEIAVLQVSPAMKLKDLKIIPAKLPMREDHPIPKTMTIAGFSHKSNPITDGEMRWANVTTICFNRTDYVDYVIWWNNNAEQPKAVSNVYDVGGPAFDKDYNLIGVATRHKLKQNVYYSRVSKQLDFLESAIKEFNDKKQNSSFNR